jgi:hypothetical protein
LGVAENIGDFLTYWIFEDQSKQVLAQSRCNYITKTSALSGILFLHLTKSNKLLNMGDIKPHKDIILEKLSNIMDDYDDEETDPEPHYFDAKSTGKVHLVDKGSVPQPASIMPIQVQWSILRYKSVPLCPC